VGFYEKVKHREGRHVGLDFYDLLIEAHHSKSVLLIALLLINLEVKPMIGMVRTGVQLKRLGR
jgi:hypothetical protein